MSDSEGDNYAMSQDESDFEPDVPKKAAPKAAPKTKAPAAKKTAVAPKAKATKTANGSGSGAASKKRKLSDGSDIDDKGSDNDDDSAATPPPPKAQKKHQDYTESKAIEDIYQKKTPLEHILLRPDTYIGTTEMKQDELWVLDPDSTKFVNRTVNIVPGLYKIVDEIIVNAADNKIRDPTMDTIKIEIDKEKGMISVYNNGKGIPVEIHKKEGCYVPELIFGHLLTSSNYDDSQKKVTGGRNGYGAKLCNIFSTEFIVETADKKSEKVYKQVFSNNMSKMGKPKITEMKKKDEYTKISFKPDFERFNMQEIDADLEALLKKRAYDLAGCVKGVKVFLNGERIKIKSFREYIDMYIPTPAEGEEKVKVIYDSPNDRWEIACIPSDGGFTHVSFVNSISTSKGGVHVDYIANQIVKELVQTIKKKSKSATIKPHHIKGHMWVFVNCLIENPAFDSQTKETMTLKQSAFGSKCELSEKFMKDIIKSPIVDGVVSLAAFKDSQALKKSDGTTRNRISDIPKLEDAHKAGPRGKQCTLILTEGDSAKTLVMAGFSVIGRDYFGVFPLRGKLLNVRDAATNIIVHNKEIDSIKKILGLKQGKVYTSVDDLRYGHLMIMTDQDHDGSHIKGLVINFFDHFFPSLLKLPGFLVEFITPIVKATKGREKKAFFTIPEYEAWKEAQDGAKGWKIKYYKGLGTSTKEDAKDYFSQMDHHKKEFAPSTDDARALVDMAFNKKKADERKEWLSNFQPGTYLDTSIDKIPISDFINKELILFSMADNIRSIPSMVDGLKPGQRKVIFGAFKKKITGELKVAQLGGYVSEKAAYHHGEQSLHMTIVGLAQDFVGSNNVNLLSPNGQFGSRMQGGKDAASARYIFTAVPAITRRVFHPQDDALLKHLNDDGDWIEPEYYVPVLPMVLVNGSEGIGTGWSSNIPNYNPADIIANLRRLMKGEPQEPMLPWYRGFVGTIEKESEHKYKISGLIEELDETRIKISELPIRTWTTPYKEQLESWIKGSDKAPSWVKDFRDDGTLSRIDLTVTLTAEQLRKARNEGLESKFKLVGSVSTSNMVCFDPQGRIKKYSSPEEIVQEFYDLRIDFYRKRKDHLIDIYTKQWTRLDNKVRFILMIISGELVVQNRKKAVIVEDLRAKGFNSEADLDVDSEAVADVPDPLVPKIKVDRGNEYDYLLKLPIWSLTYEKVEQLRGERDSKKNELNILIDKTPFNLWDEDLDAFTVAWEEVLQADIDEANYMGSGNKSKKIPAARGRALGAKPAVKKVDLDDDDFEEKKLKKVPAVKKSTPASVEVKKESEVIKTAVKQEPISNFFGRSSTASAETPSVTASSSVQKKQQSIMDMMKPKTAPAKPAPVKSEAMSEDDTPVVKSSVKRGTGRSKKIISDDDEDEDDYGATDGVNSDGYDDGDVEMMDVVEVTPREPSSRAPRAARAKRAVIVDQDSDFEDDEDDFLPVSRKSTIPPVSPRKMTKSSQPDPIPVKKPKQKKAVAEEIESSADERYTPKSIGSNAKGKVTYKSRTRVIRSDSEAEDDDEDEDVAMDTAGAADDDDDEDDYVETKSKKRGSSASSSTKKKPAAAAAAPTPAPGSTKSKTGQSVAKEAVKKMFSLSNDDDDDEDMSEAANNLDTQQEGGEERDAGDGGLSGPDEQEPVRTRNVQTTIPTAIVDEDDDVMFSISAPSKVSQVKKRATLPVRSGSSSSISSVGGGSGGGGGGSTSQGGSSSSGVADAGGLPLSFSTSVTSTGAVAGAKTLNSASSGPAKVPKAVASSQLLADLDDVSMFVSRPNRAKTMSKKPMYVDISDEE